ncbi:hypothetical protein RUND412_003431 [Rhizina undulata]
MDNFFVNALVRASLCKTHSSSYCSTNLHFRRTNPTASPRRRSYYTGDPGRYSSERYQYSARLKSELVSIVDPYFNNYSSLSSVVFEEAEEPARHRRERLSYKLPNLPWEEPANPDEENRLQEFLKCIKDVYKPLDELFHYYRQLPAPRVSYLTSHHLDQLISRFMSVPKRDEVSMLRYLSILDDLRAAGLPIKRNEWNAAISFVGRSFREVTHSAVKAALDLWKESEEVAGVPADVTTFNILFDIIVRTENPMLAELVIGEMNARGISLDRFTKTSIIMYHGIRADGPKVRDVYREMVDTGELVDTVVLNAVMTALFKAKEPGAAEYIYEKMKSSAVDSAESIVEFPPLEGNFLELRRWGRMLAEIAANRRIIKDYMKEFNVSLDPDIITFNMMLLHFSSVGDYGRIQKILQEMEEFGVKRNTSIYISICKGFYWKGGVKHSEFTKERLEEVIAEVMEKDSGIIVERSLAVWILMAVAKIFNSKKRLVLIWEDLEEVCRRQDSVIDPAALAYIESIIGKEEVDAARRERKRRKEELESEMSELEKVENEGVEEEQREAEQEDQESRHEKKEQDTDPTKTDDK